MKTSNAGIELLKKAEGLKLTSYKCSAGVWTIGYGHTGKEVIADMKITEAKAEELLRKDIRSSELAVTGNVKVMISQNQFDALVSLVFNIGTGAFTNSTLLKCVNQDPNSDEVINQFRKWVFAGKVKIPGLVNRRESEIKHYRGR